MTTKYVCAVLCYQPC